VTRVTDEQLRAMVAAHLRIRARTASEQNVIDLGNALLAARARIAELEAEVYRTSVAKAAFDEAAR
jgi:hypothetical protein